MTKKINEHQCELLNRTELSCSQQQKLQRFIDNNLHSISCTHLTGDYSSPSLTGAINRININEDSSSNKRKKEVKWYDDNTNLSVQRARSSSPIRQQYRSEPDPYSTSSFSDKERRSKNTNMSHKNETNYLIQERDNQYRRNDPDNYNRYDTARSRSRQSQYYQKLQDEERGRFHGYGDRPGSGVELMPSKWRGGEVISSPVQLPHSLKPRRLYYSPIGDGVVAADGVELKRVPKDLSPQITVQHFRNVERGEPGKAGYNIYERTTSQAGAGSESDFGKSGVSARLASPNSDYYAQSGPEPDYNARQQLDYKSEPPITDKDRYGPRASNGYSPPTHSVERVIPLKYDGKDAPFPKADNYHGTTYKDEPANKYPMKDRSESVDPLGDVLGDFPNDKGDGRSSVASFYGMSSERSRKFDAEKSYLITNPRELIHQYATTTPVAVLDIPESTHTISKKYSKVTEEKYTPYPPYKGGESSVHPNNFVRKLRDEGLTSSQRRANEHQEPLTSADIQSNERIHEIQQQSNRAPAVEEIDYLTEKMMQGLYSNR